MDFTDRYQYFKIHIQKGKIMNDLVIKTENLTKIYGEQKAVKSVKLNVKKGRIYELPGRNGAGKTTIMKMILGLFCRI